MDYLDEIDGLYSLVYTREAMAFKRSAVRSRLSPPGSPEIVRFQDFLFSFAWDLPRFTVFFEPPEIGVFCFLFTSESRQNQDDFIKSIMFECVSGSSENARSNFVIAAILIGS